MFFLNQNETNEIEFVRFLLSEEKEIGSVAGIIAICD